MKVKRGIEHYFDLLLHNPARKRVQDWLDRKGVFYHAVAWVRRVLRRAFKVPPDAYEVWCIGQSHLDAAWKWDWRVSVRRAILTFQRAIENLEKNPFFTISMSSPQYYAWVKKYRPELYAKVKEHVETGRFEHVGGCWVEPDVNLASGESLVRQRLHGQHFYIREFGAPAKVAVLSDSFGFPWTLPQILVKSGARYFWTNKLSWNDLNEFPLATFIWRGPDGSEIFTHCFRFNVTGIPLWKDYGRLNCFPDRPGLTFSTRDEPEEVTKHVTEEHARTLGFFYGLGDGGGGPLEEEVLVLKNWARIPRREGRKVKFANTLAFFRRLEREFRNVPTWNDELYLEYHRGCYTSVEAVKRLNRFCENALHDAEWYASLAQIVAGTEYPAYELEGAWRRVLFNQFHDVLPGSSRQEVYLDAEADHLRALRTCHDVASRSLTALLAAAKLDAHARGGLSGRALVVWNPLAWARREPLLLHRPGNRAEGDDALEPSEPPVALTGPDGRRLLAQEVFNGLLVEPVTVPSKGFVVLGIDEGIFEVPETGPTDLFLYADGSIRVENEHLRVVVDARTGFLSSLFDARAGRELLAGPGHELKVYEDDPREYPAWNVDKRYTRRRFPLGPPVAVKVVDDGPLQKTVQASWTHERSFIMAHYVVRAGVPEVRFHLYLDWRTPKRLVKVNFPLALDTNDVVCEVPFGAVVRKIRPETKWDEAKWEFPSLRWVDASDERGGVTLLNNSKYGFSASARGVAMTILRTPKFTTDPFYTTHQFVPKWQRAKYSDLKEHRVEYALRLHEGDWRTGACWRRGREFNHPVLAREVPRAALGGESRSSLVPGRDLVTVEPPNVLLVAWKAPHLPREGGGGGAGGDAGAGLEVEAVVRFLECAGEATRATVQFDLPADLAGVEEVDLLELELPARAGVAELTHGASGFSFQLRPHEVKTFKVRFRSRTSM
ncbi:MAG: alpha-mannosidase [Promethearchaeota archaeon]